MAIDPSIPLQARSVQLADPMELAGRAMTLRELGLRSQAEQQQLSKSQRDIADQQKLADLYRGAVKDDGTIDSEALTRGMATAGLGAQIPGVQKAALETRKTRAETSGAELDVHKKKLDLINGSFASLLTKPNLTHDDVIGAINGWVDQGVLTPEEGAQRVRELPGPNGLRPFLIQKAVQALDASKRLEAMLPKVEYKDTGSEQTPVDMNPVTNPNPVPLKKTLSPDERAKIDLAKSRGIGFGAPAGDLLAALAARGVSLPAGMRSKEQQIATVNGLLRKYPEMTPDEIADQVATGQINFGAAKKEITVAAGQAGRVAVAANELKTFGDQVLEASAAVPRGNFVPVGRLLQMADTQISDPALLRFKAKMQALNSAYDQLAARGGTDADKRAHIHQLFQTAAGPEAVAALVQALREESAGALEAAAKAQEYHPPKAADVPADIAAILKTHGSK